MIGLAVMALIRAPLRTAIRVVVLAAAAALLGAMVLFVGHSLRTMTAATTRSVPLDWQAPVGSQTAATQVASVVRRQTGVVEAVAAATAPFAGITHVGPAGTIQSSAGAILAVPPNYLSHIGTFRFLRGALKPGEIVFDQQLAATLQVAPGDIVELTPRRGAAPLRFRVSGIALVTAPDTLFQPLDPLLGPAPAQPPADIAIVPLQTFARRIAHALPSIAQAEAGAAAVPGEPLGTQWQVQAQINSSSLSGSPGHALTSETRLRNGAERALLGRARFVDDLGDALTNAAGDALYAEALYIMLAVPGALVALGLAYLAALGAADRERRELALFRARGAARRDLFMLALAESAALGLVAGALGAGGALLALRAAVPHALGLGSALVAAAFGICGVVATLGALAAKLGVGARAFTRTIVEGRRTSTRSTRPLWQRLYVDFAALALSGLVYWLTARTGFSAVVNPDSNPTLSLSVYMFLAPASLWIGATLLLVRLRGRVFERLFGSRRANRMPGFLLASAARRSAALNRGLVLLGLLLAFGVELAVFSATYDQQAQVDAQLTLGADVVVAAPPQSLARLQLASVPGVAGVSGVDHAYAYVGPDLQDTFGIDASTLPQATTLRNSYFLGSSASQALAQLRSRSDAVLVSKETISDYSLQLGDLLRLRVLDHRTGRFHVVPFHVAGVVQEFPSAPRDSFMVANLSYLLAVTHDAGPNVLFVRSSEDPVATAQHVAAAAPGASVKNIRQQAAQTVSSITAVDLGGIGRLEEGFTIALATLAMILFLAVGLAERRQEFATMAALGAPVRTIASFLWTEVALVLGAALVLAALLGWGLAEMLVAMLRHVFDPPPDHLATPWGFLSALGGAALAGAAVASSLAAFGVHRLRLGAILREE